MAGIMVVLGTRPEAIKLAPVVQALRRRGLLVRVCSTAQHRDLVDQFAEEHDLGVDFDLDLMRAGQGVAEFVARSSTALDRLFARSSPARVIVQGDTATAFAAAQAAYLTGIPVGHVEAGLRTGDIRQPWPEESFRKAIALWSDLHFAPTARAAKALRAEGVNEDSIHVTGNTIVDAYLSERSRLAPLHSCIERVLQRAGSRKIVLATCHRRENIGPGLERIATALRAIAERPDVLVIVPVHPNPQVREPITRALPDRSGIEIVDALPFGPFLQLLGASHFVVTDSGGVQEEAPLLGTPLLVAREVTERPEGLEAGTAKLVGTSVERIVSEAMQLLDDPLHHARMARKHSPYGDGRAADRIAEILLREAVPTARASGE